MIIVGGGLIGASIAFELAAENLRVAVLDRREPGQEASWAAAGMLSPGPHAPEDEPLGTLGAESLRLYPEFVAAVEEVSERSVGFLRDGAIEVFYGLHAEQDRDNMVASHRHLGLPAEGISLEGARELVGTLGRTARAAAWLAGEATVEPRLLVAAVLEGAFRRGVEIRAGCAVDSLVCEGGGDGSRCIGVIAQGMKIEAQFVVLAAGCFSGEIEKAGGLRTSVPTRPVRGQMLALRSKAMQLRRVLRSEHGYLVPRRDGRIIAGSTTEEAGFAKHTTPEGIRNVLSAALELVPDLADAEILESWAGLRPGTPDDLPILGPTGIEGLLAATGHYRNGILLAPVTADLVRDWIIRGKVDADVRRFSPARFDTAAVDPFSSRSNQAVG